MLSCVWKSKEIKTFALWNLFRKVGTNCIEVPFYMQLIKDGYQAEHLSFVLGAFIPFSFIITYYV